MSLPTKSSSSSSPSSNDDQKIVTTSENIDQQQIENDNNAKESVIENVVNTSIEKTSLPLNNEKFEKNDEKVASNKTHSSSAIKSSITLIDLERALANTADNNNIKINSNSTQNSNIESCHKQLDNNENLSLELNRIADESIKSKKTNDENNLSTQEYHLKWIKWKNCNNIASVNNNDKNNDKTIQQNINDNKVPIVTQNSNGSCPLLAIINVLLLRRNITFPSIIEIVTASQLMDYLCDCILNYVPKNLPEQVKLNYEQNLQDAISIMPRLQTGLDVNVKFTGIMDFEYTPECIIFDLLRIPLYHGWLVDPQHRELSRIINNQSYNQLIDKIIDSKANNSNDNEMFLAEEFLNQTASQLTNYGLSQLIRHIKDDELAILFRNNHFITVYKNKGKLYQLVTDQGFLTEQNVVWESLNNIEGNDYFVDADFQLVPPKPSSLLPSSPSSSSSTTTTIARQMPNLNIQQQIDQDYLIALSLEQEQNFEVEHQQQKNKSITSVDDNNNSDDSNKVVIDDNEKNLMSDEELARKLQAEEDRLFEQSRKQQIQTVDNNINKNRTYASVLSSSTQQKQQTKKNTKDTNHHQISSCGENSTTSFTSSEPHARTISSNSRHNQQKDSNINQSNYQRSTEQTSMSTPVTPTSPTTGNMSDDRQSVSSRRSNKNCEIS